MKSLRGTDVLIALALFALNLALNFPLLLPGDTPYRDSIEGGYAGMARFVNAHPSPWGWNPLAYCGLSTQFLYVPALLYAVWLLPGDPVYGYKLLTASLTCLGPVTLYMCFVFFTGSRFWGTLTALGYTFGSPVYGLISQADKDRGLTYLPWRLHVYAKYGEGPHNVGLTLMPLAWMALWLAGMGRRYWQIFVLAVLMAAITLTNWIAGLALAIMTLLFLAAMAGMKEFRARRIFLAGALAYGLACFWLTPTFIHTIAFNWPADAFNYKLEQTQYRLLMWCPAVLAGLWLLLRWLRWPPWEKFLTLSLAAFTLPVMAHYGAGVDMIPESRRYALEFELFLVASIGAFLRFVWTGSNRVRQVCGAVLLVALAAGGAAQIRQYLVQSREPLRPVAKERTPEYQAAKWLAGQNPAGRVLVSGGLRFRLHSWFDLAQAGGSFESGLRNRTPVHFAYHVRTSAETTDSIRELKALGVEYVVIHGPKSAEHYRDYANPAKFEGVLAKVYEDADDVIYRVPFHGLAHAIRPDEEPAAAFRGHLESYVRALEDPGRPQLTAKWQDTNRLRIEGRVPDGMQISVQVSYDPGWKASNSGAPVAVEKDSLGFIKLRTPGPVDLHYGGTVEQKLFATFSAITWMAALALLWRNKR